MDTPSLDQSNNKTFKDPSPKKTLCPKTRKQIFEPSLGNDFRGENIPDWAKKLYLEPLLEGWRREVVTRSVPSLRSSGQVPDVDIYYWPPEGRKLRSRPEIAEYLKVNGITKLSAVFNFSFKKQAFGGEFEPYETVRNAGSGTKLGRPSLPKGCQTSLKRSHKKAITKNTNVTQNIEPKFGPIMLTGDDISPDIKRQKVNYETSEEYGMTTPDDKLYCVCNDVEKGQMILCDNSECEIGWYHFECVRLCEEDPRETWYCPICRGPTSDVINPSYIRDKER